MIVPQENSSSTAVRDDILQETLSDRVLSPRLVGLPILIALIVLMPFVLRTSYQFDIVILIGINAIVAIGLNLLMGYAGQISLGHAAFFGAGAYGSTVLAGDYAWPALVALLTSSGAASLFAYIVARPILRLSGHYLAMATLGLGMIFHIVITTERTVTGGPDGRSVPTFEIAGNVITSPQAWYWIVAVLLVLIYWGLVNLIDSPLGRALRAVKGSEIAAQTVSVDVSRLKALVFVLSAGIAAFMGGIFAFYSGFISPNSADFMHSVIYATMVVLGGTASIVGSIVGAVIMTLLPQYLTSFAQFEWLIYGLVLVAIVIFMPQGLVPTVTATLRSKRK